MRKTLRNLVGGVIFGVGSLLIPTGCLEKVDKSISDLTQKTAQQATGTNAYDEALKIAKDPASVFNGNAVKEVPAKQLPSRTEKAIVQRNLGLNDYFFQGKELEGLEIPGAELTGKEFPYVLGEREIVDFEQNSGWDLNNAVKVGISAYVLSNREIKLTKSGTVRADSFGGDKVNIEQVILEFDSERDNWKFLKEIEQTEKGLVFMNKNFSSFIFPNVNGSLEEEKILVDSLMNYAKRVGGEFYGSQGSFKEYEEIYQVANIPVSDSAEYLSEALKFQRKMYGMNESQLADVFDKELGFQLVKDKLDQYKDEKIGKDELERELLKYSKRSLNKLFFILPNMNSRIFCSKDLPKLEGPIEAICYCLHQKDNHQKDLVGNYIIGTLLKSIE